MARKKKRETVSAETSPRVQAAASAAKPESASSAAAPSDAGLRIALVWLSLWPYVLLAALSFALYARTMNNGFVSDDHAQIDENPVIRDVHNIPKIFMEDVWGRGAGGEAKSSFYRPTQLLLCLLIFKLAGLHASAFHLMMVLFHVFNTLLVFALSKKLLENLSPPVLPVLPAAMAASILFAVHPIHVEAVAWISVLPDCLMTAIALCIMLFFVYRPSPTLLQCGVQAVLFFVALLTKETSVAILPLLAAYEWLYLGRGFREILRNIKLYVALALSLALYLFVRVLALGSLAPHQGGNGFNLHGLDLLMNVSILMGRYFWKLFLPTNLNFFHLYEPIHKVNLELIVSAIAIAAVLAAMLLLRRRSPLVSFSIAWIILPLIPVMNLNGINTNAFAERYLYLPSVGFVWIIALAWDRLRQMQSAAAWSALAIVAAASTVSVESRISEWRDDVTLFSITSRQVPQDVDLHFTLAAAYGKAHRIDEASREYRAAFALRPASAKQDYVNFALLLERNGRIAEAIQVQEEIVRRWPDDLGALNDLASKHIALKDDPGAIAILERVVARDPNFVTAQMNLGFAYFNMNRFPEAIPHFGKAIEKDTGANLPLLHYATGIAYARLNHKAEAISELETAVKMQPNNENMQRALATVRAQK